MTRSRIRSRSRKTDELLLARIKRGEVVEAVLAPVDEAELIANFDSSGERELYVSGERDPLESDSNEIAAAQSVQEGITTPTPSQGREQDYSEIWASTPRTPPPMSSAATESMGELPKVDSPAEEGKISNTCGEDAPLRYPILILDHDDTAVDSTRSVHHASLSASFERFKDRIDPDAECPDLAAWLRRL